MSLTVQNVGGGGLSIKNGVSKQVTAINPIEKNMFVSLTFNGVIDTKNFITDDGTGNHKKIGMANDINSSGNHVFLLQINSSYIKAVEVSMTGVIKSVGKSFYFPYYGGNDKFLPLGSNKFFTTGYTANNNTTYEFILSVDLETLEITQKSKKQIGTGSSVFGNGITLDRNTILSVNSLGKLFSVDYEQDSDTIIVGSTVSEKKISTTMGHGVIGKVSENLILLRGYTSVDSKYTTYVQLLDLTEDKLGAMLTMTSKYAADMYGFPVLNGNFLIACQSNAPAPVRIGKAEVDLATLDVSSYVMQNDTFPVVANFEYVKGIILIDQYVAKLKDTSPYFEALICQTAGGFFNGIIIGSYRMSYNSTTKELKISAVVFDELIQSNNEGTITIGVSAESAHKNNKLNVIVSPNAALRIPD